MVFFEGLCLVLRTEMYGLFAKQISSFGSTTKIYFNVCVCVYVHTHPSIGQYCAFVQLYICFYMFIYKNKQ